MKKEDIRKIYKEKRKALTSEELSEKSERIHHLVRSTFELRNKTCSIFLPIHHQNEINTFLIIDDSDIENVQFVVSKSDFSSLEMSHYKYESKQQLRENNWGIPEPMWGEQIFLEEIDLVFVPLLAMDRYGNRVGYGKGFYDRFLANCSKKCEFIGLTLFDEFVEIDDLSSDDIPMHKCITPYNFYCFEQKSPR